MTVFIAWCSSWCSSLGPSHCTKKDQFAYIPAVSIDKYPMKLCYRFFPLDTQYHTRTSSEQLEVSCTFYTRIEIDLCRLPDRYVLLLQNVVKENWLLRQQIRQTIEAGQSSLQEINLKVDNLAAAFRSRATNRVGQTGRLITIPIMCSVSTIWQCVLSSEWLLHPSKSNSVPRAVKVISPAPNLKCKFYLFVESPILKIEDLQQGTRYILI